MTVNADWAARLERGPKISVVPELDSEVHLPESWYALQAQRDATEEFFRDTEESPWETERASG